MSSQPPTNSEVDILEEDDEFEEFETQNWGAEEEDKEDEREWEEGWEDEDVDDDFANQLRAELQKNK